MPISCPTFTPRPTVVGRLALLGLSTAANPQWVCCLVVFLTPLLEGITSTIAFSGLTLLLGVVSWFFNKDTENVEKAPLAKQWSSNYDWNEVKEIWPNQKEYIPRIGFSLYLLTGVCGAVVAIDSGITTIKENVILSMSLFLAAVAFIYYFSKHAESIKFAKPVQSKQTS